MRFTAVDGSTVHLSYCSNVHAAEDADGVLAQLSAFAGPVRAELGVDRLGVGLWLSARAAADLDADAARLSALRRELDRQGLEVVTLNGFPYGGFHDTVVKHAVYRPDWTTAVRAAHTVRLARLLAALLPEDVHTGTISTLPLAHVDGWSPVREAAALRRLRGVADALERLRAETGKSIVLALEAEPGCVLETTTQVADLLGRLDRPQVQACLDTAHLAVQWEDPVVAVPALAASGGIAKAQLSTALHVSDPRADEDLLRAHDEPRYLHQVRQRGGGGVDDLPQALSGRLSGEDAWRVHVHLPLHADPARTTSPELEKALAALVGGDVPLTRSLEVETYTWSVLPEGLRPQDDAGLVRGIASEVAWAADRLVGLGLVRA